MTGQKSQFNVLGQPSVAMVSRVDSYIRAFVPHFILKITIACVRCMDQCMYVNKTMLLTCMCIFICKQVNYFELLITYARIKFWASTQISFHGHHLIIVSIYNPLSHIH